MYAKYPSAVRLLPNGVPAGAFLTPALRATAPGNLTPAFGHPSPRGGEGLSTLNGEWRRGAIDKR